MKERKRGKENPASHSKIFAGVAQLVEQLISTSLTKAAADADGFVRDVDPRNTRQQFLRWRVFTEWA